MGADRLIRPGAVRRAMRTHRASDATPPMSRSAPPQAGFFCPVALLRCLSDAHASHCQARLATGQHNPGQMVPIDLDPL